MFALNMVGEIFGKVSHYETYAYRTVVQHLSAKLKWEVRKYPSAVAATMGGGGDSGFRHLARYIGVFTEPQNVAASSSSGAKSEAVNMTTPVVMKSEHVSMTTPVVQKGIVGTGSRSQDMSFILPSKYKLVKDAPKPLNSNIKIELTPEKLVAATTFNGTANHADMEKKYAELKPLIEAAGYEIAGQWEAHYFNPPYTIGIFRRNDLVVPIKPKEDGGGCSSAL